MWRVILWRCSPKPCQSCSPQETAYSEESKRPLGNRCGVGGVTLGGKLNLTAACVDVEPTPANLCRERSRLPRCSSGCEGKSLGTQVTGWCPSCPGCNLRTALSGEKQTQGEKKTSKVQQRCLRRWQSLSGHFRCNKVLRHQRRVVKINIILQI